MKVVLFGVRGTTPVTLPEFTKYGGDTTSVLVEGNEGETVALDAGTGIRLLGDFLKEGVSAPFLLLLTHYHLDHVMGLPTFRPLYDKKYTITIAAPRRDGFTAEEVVPRIMDQPFWPLQIGNLQAMVGFSTLDGPASVKPLWHGRLEIRWAPLHHPGGCTAYRIDEPSSGSSLLFATDLEWEESAPEEISAFRRLGANPSPPDLLVFDGQFNPKNYENFRGWGHSTWENAVEAARTVGAKRLVVTHHAPESDDAYLDGIAAELKERMPEAELGRGGMEIVLGDI